MMSFDFMLENGEGELALIDIVETFLRGLEENFRAAVYQEEWHLSFYEERKQECLEAIPAQ
ncbi:MAG: hypothetical protein SWQ30_07230 [Thermodesulfobacteriota bacterium]|nr:hypothetical protein [Thermodesulfobacteriota bacterium]